MSSELLHQLSHAEAAEQIAETLWMAHRGDSVLMWDELPKTLREEYRARGREAVRSCLPHAVQAARVAVARALVREDGHEWDDLGPTTRARYRNRAVAACARYRWHLAESAYPEHIERAMGDAFELNGQTLGQRVEEARKRAQVVGFGDRWRNEFAQEA